MARTRPFIATVLAFAAASGAVALGADEMFSYDTIECPSADSYAEVAKDVHLADDQPGKLCGGSRRSKLARLLNSMRRLRTDLPKNWKGGAADALADPLRYLARSNRALRFDFKQNTAMAYNENETVYLGSGFFERLPWQSITALIHESRHSSRNDPRHTSCTQGDLPYRSGGCDESLRADSGAGAYAYEVSFEYGLARHNRNINEADRNFLVSDALATIGTRFNRAPESLARPHELIAALDENGEVSFVHPFLPELVETGVSIPGKKITRIEYDWANGGLFLYTSDKKTYSWMLGMPGVSGMPELVRDETTGAELQLQDYAYVTIDELQGRYYLDEKNQIWRKGFNPSIGKPEARLLERNHQPGRLQAARLLGSSGQTTFLFTHAGELLKFGDPAFDASGFQAPDGAGWQFAASGVLSDFIYALDRKGMLYYRESGGLRALSSFQLSPQLPTTGLSPLHAVKFQEGATFHAMLDDQNDLIVDRYATDAPTVIRLGADRTRIVDFAILRAPTRFSDSGKRSSALSAFSRRCRLSSSPAADPWLGRGVGTDEKGRLVFEGDDAKPCLELDKGPEQVEQVTFDGDAGYPSDENQFYPRVRIDLSKGDGSNSSIKPYSITYQ